MYEICRVVKFMEIEKQDGGYQGMGREQNGELLLTGTEFQVYEIKCPKANWDIQAIHPALCQKQCLVLLIYQGRRGIRKLNFVLRD